MPPIQWTPEKITFFWTARGQPDRKEPPSDEELLQLPSPPEPVEDPTGVYAEMRAYVEERAHLLKLDGLAGGRPIGSPVVALFAPVPASLANPEGVALVSEFLGCLTDYNRGPVLALFEKYASTLEALGDSFIRHLELYLALFRRFGRPAFTLLDGMLAATQAGSIPRDLSENDIQGILSFTENTRSFLPAVYARHHEAFSEKHHRLRRIFDEKPSPAEIEKIWKEYPVSGLIQNYAAWALVDDLGPEDLQWALADSSDYTGALNQDILLAVVQRLSPTRATSDLSLKDLWSFSVQLIQAGDFRDHIPEAWRGDGRVEILEPLTGEKWALKAGETADPEKRVFTAVESLRLREAEGAPPATQAKLIQAINDYLLSKRPVSVEGKLDSTLTRYTDEKLPADESTDEMKGRLQDYLLSRNPEAAREKLEHLLTRYAGSEEAVKEQITRAQDAHSAALLLKDLFAEKGVLARILQQAMDELPRELLMGEGKKQNVDKGNNGKAGLAIAGSLKKAWEAPDKPRHERLETLSDMVNRYESADIESEVLTHMDDPELRTQIQQILAKGEGLPLNKKNLVKEILKPMQQVIETENKKYVKQATAPVHLSLRAVKGPLYGLHGLNTGICTRWDLGLWQKPAYKLLAITDDTQDQIEGYIEVFETPVGDKKYLSVVGFNPSFELMDRVDPKLLFRKLMEKVDHFAQRADYEGVFIPTNESILTNRDRFKAILKQEKYRIIEIPEVHWDTIDKPHPFSEVYVRWEKNKSPAPGGTKPPAGSPDDSGKSEKGASGNVSGASTRVARAHRAHRSRIREGRTHLSRLQRSHGFNFRTAHRVPRNAPQVQVKVANFFERNRTLQLGASRFCGVAPALCLPFNSIRR